MIPLLDLIRPSPHKPCLRFAPLAWLKLQYFCHAGDTEVGGFGISPMDGPLYVEDFVSVRQEVTGVSVRFLDEAVADFFDGCVDAGLAPQQFSRLWCHTHPGDLATPSSRDEATFARCFGGCDWSLMFILARSGQTYARLSFAAGPGGQMEISTAVDWSSWPGCLQQRPGMLEAMLTQWEQEYAANIIVLPPPVLNEGAVQKSGLDLDGWNDRWEIVNPPSGEVEHEPAPF